jgi:H2-forming N5,N10-methylenetetrahydromethanopterin dehydrogenase-like enzyme
MKVRKTIRAKILELRKGKEEARRMVKAGEVLCSTCTVEAIIRSYVLEKRNRC